MWELYTSTRQQHVGNKLIVASLLTLHYHVIGSIHKIVYMHNYISKVTNTNMNSNLLIIIKLFLKKAINSTSGPELTQTNMYAYICINMA